MIHVVPVDDVEEHILESTCKCNPRAEVTEGGGIMVVHNAWDKREILEKVRVILGESSTYYKPWALFDDTKG